MFDVLVGYTVEQEFMKKVPLLSGFRSIVRLQPGFWRNERQREETEKRAAGRFCGTSDV